MSEIHLEDLLFLPRGESNEKKEFSIILEVGRSRTPTPGLRVAVRNFNQAAIETAH